MRVLRGVFLGVSRCSGGRAGGVRTGIGESDSDGVLCCGVWLSRSDVLRLAGVMCVLLSGICVGDESVSFLLRGVDDMQ